MSQEVYDWILLVTRWLHITTAVAWIGTSIFFMWLDRTIAKGGELWMVHGGGFYQVKKMLMGTVKVPEELHWFKWEAYWTWISGLLLVILVFYTGNGSALLDSSVSAFTFAEAIYLSVIVIVVSWFFYDFLWESNLTKKKPIIGHILTLAWLGAMSYLLCHTMSGRAAFLHIGAMLGTWMTANVSLRIIPRQVKMVAAAKRGEAVNQEWAKNAKNRSTHNTYFTIPVIFLMMSNHFPATYGNNLNWLILLLMCAGGAAIREFFISRIDHAKRAKIFLGAGLVFILTAAYLTKEPSSVASTDSSHVHQAPKSDELAPIDYASRGHVKGVVKFEGTVPPLEKLGLPPGCTKKRGDIYSNAVLITNGAIKDVALRITKGLSSGNHGPVPTRSIKLDQVDCQYEPRTIAVRAGQPVEFINSDPIFHNVRSLAKLNETFNVAMPQKDDRIVKAFPNPEILQTKCSVHPWMNANLVVVEHPYFDVTNFLGEFLIRNVPSGTYTLEAWHEVFGTLTQEITIEEGQTSNLEFTFRK